MDQINVDGKCRNCVYYKERKTYGMQTDSKTACQYDLTPQTVYECGYDNSFLFSEKDCPLGIK